MACLPYFPLYPKDIFTDDRMIEMKSEEQGLFILFLCKLWINENKIKDDDARISRIIKIPQKKWRDLKDRLLESGLLEIDFAGYITNRRLTKEMKDSEVKSANGLKAARARHDKNNSTKSNNYKYYENKGGFDD